MAIYAAGSIIDIIVKAGHDLSKSRVGFLGATFKENCLGVPNTKVVVLTQRLKSFKISVSFGAPVLADVHTIYRYMRHKQLRHICPSENDILEDLKSIFDKQEFIDSDFEVFRL